MSGDHTKYYGTAETPKREWVGLTDNERIDIAHEYRNYDDAKGDWFDRTGFARAIEAKLKEKNT